MPDDWFTAVSGLVGAIIGGGISAAVSWLIAKADRKKFANERMWEMRREAYTKIISTVAALQRNAEAFEYQFTDEAGGGGNFVNSNAFLRSERAATAMEQELERLIANNRIIITSEMLRWYWELAREVEEIDELRSAETPAEIARARLDLYQERMHAVVALAQRELQVSG